MSAQIFNVRNIVWSKQQVTQPLLRPCGVLMVSYKTNPSDGFSRFQPRKPHDSPPTCHQAGQLSNSYIVHPFIPWKRKWLLWLLAESWMSVRQNLQDELTLEEETACDKADAWTGEASSAGVVKCTFRPNENHAACGPSNFLSRAEF